MKVYIVYTHPNQGSFNHALLERVAAAAREAGHEVTVSDLYADGFDPALSASDLAGLASGQTAADVAAYQEKIKSADAIVFLFPVWWFGPPAMLKGWFDRVFAKGFAYDFTPAGPKPLLKVKKALVISTAGGMEPMYKAFGFTDAITRVLVNGTLQFCGIFNVKSKIFHNVVDGGDELRKGYLEEAAQLIKGLF